MSLPEGGMYVKYGSYQHPSGEVAIEKLEATPQYSPRNEQWAILYKMHCRGDIQFTPAEAASVAGDPQAAQTLMKTKVTAFINAYTENYKTFGLYHGDGTASPHVIDQNSPFNISGTRVLYRSWPEGSGDQYVNARTFYFIMGALYDAQDSSIFAYEERIRIVGTGGTKWRWVDNPLNLPIKQTIYTFTHQRIEQFGYIVGLNGWLLGNVPPPLYPQYEHEEIRPVMYDYPEWQGNAYRLYGYRWHYIMEAPSGMPAIPTLY